jgi:hypothetical protein
LEPPLWLLEVRGSRLVGVPKGFLEVELETNPAAPDEKSVAEAVEVAESGGGHFLAVGEADDETLGPPADCAADMQFAVQPTPSGQHK